MTVDYEFIGKRIRDCRNSRQITQEQLAQKIFKSFSHHIPSFSLSSHNLEIYVNSQEHVHRKFGVHGSLSR